MEVSLNGAQNHDEFMVLNDARCPRLTALFEQGLRISSDELDAEQLDVIHTIEHACCWHAPLEWKLISYRDWFSCRRAAGKAVPAVLDQVSSRLDAATSRQMHQIFEGGASFTDDPEGTRNAALRLAIGRLCSLVVDTLGRPDGCLHLYSGHDWTLSPLLMCMVRPDDPMLGQWPPFCSNLAIELWSTRPADRKAAGGAGLSDPFCQGSEPSLADEGRHVRCVFNGQPVDMCCSPAGQQTCTLTEFKQMLSAFCVRDFAAECRAGDPTSSGKQQAKPSFNR